MADRIIGICGNCGGKVALFSGAWFGVVPPKPTCTKCGSVSAQQTIVLPVLPMETFEPNPYLQNLPIPK